MKTITLVFMVSVVLTAIPVSIGFAWDQAQSEFDAIREKIPDEWWSYDWDKIEELEDFLAKGYDKPDLYAQAQYFLAFNYRMKGNHEKALELYTQLIETYPQVESECAKAQFEIGQIYRFDVWNLAKAISEYRKVIANYPEHFLCTQAQIAIARCYLQQKDYATALIEYQKVIDNYPDTKKQHVEAYMDMGDMVREQGDIEKALFYYKNAYLSCPSDDADALKWIVDIISGALTTKGESLESTREFITSLSAEKEKQEPTNAIEMATLNQSVDSLKNKLTLTFNPREREKIIKQLIEEYESMVKMPSYTDLEINKAKEEMALLKFELREEDEALELAEEVLYKYPGGYKMSELMWKIIIKKATMLRIKGKFDEAIAEYQKLADANVNGHFKIVAKNGIASIYVQNGQIKEAVETYESIIEEYPASPWADMAKEKLKELSNEKTN